MTARARDPTSEEWTTRRDGGRRALVRGDFADAFDRLGLLRAADVDPAELALEARPFRPPGGRGSLALVPAGSLGDAVVRRYRRGGLPARFTEDRYFLGDRAFRELDLTLGLDAAGVPVATPLAAVQSAAHPGYRAAMVTVHVADAVPAAEELDRAGEDRRRHALRRMGRSIRGLHGAGVLHADLNVHNFLLPESPGGRAVLLDLDRARRLPVAATAVLGRLNLRRLRRSMAKEGLDVALEEFGVLEGAYRAADLTEAALGDPAAGDEGSRDGASGAG